MNPKNPKNPKNQNYLMNLSYLKCLNYRLSH
jgi:hypothetical protein